MVRICAAVGVAAHWVNEGDAAGGWVDVGRGEAARRLARRRPVNAGARSVGLNARVGQ